MRFAFNRLFYRGKHIKKENKDGLTTLLLPSMLGIFACVVCLMGMTFAWFSATQETQIQTIEVANYSASVSIDGEAADKTAALEIGAHTVSITADGTATTGYFVIEYGDQKRHTAQVGKGGTISFTFEANEAVTLNITPQWGTSARSEEEKLHEGDNLIFGEPAPLVCTCEAKCAELNEACEACKTDITLCTGKEITCTCETKCTELNAACEICKTDFTLCIGAEATPPEVPADEEKTCTCETKCTELNVACEVCKTDFALCIGAEATLPEAPAGEEKTCTCETKCTELNAACEVCKTDFTLCVGAATTQLEAPADDNPPADEQGTEQGEEPAEGTDEVAPPTEDIEPADTPAENMNKELEETQAPTVQESSEDDEEQQQDQQNEQDIIL